MSPFAHQPDEKLWDFSDQPGPVRPEHLRAGAPRAARGTREHLRAGAARARGLARLGLVEVKSPCAFQARRHDAGIKLSRIRLCNCLLGGRVPTRRKKWGGHAREQRRRGTWEQVRRCGARKGRCSRTYADRPAPDAQAVLSGCAPGLVDLHKLHHYRCGYPVMVEFVEIQVKLKINCRSCIGKNATGLQEIFRKKCNRIVGVLFIVRGSRSASSILVFTTRAANETCSYILQSSLPPDLPGNT